MSYMLSHLHNGWQVDQAILSEEDRVVVSSDNHNLYCHIDILKLEFIILLLIYLLFYILPFTYYINYRTVFLLLEENYKPFL